MLICIMNTATLTITFPYYFWAVILTRTQHYDDDDDDYYYYKRCRFDSMSVAVRSGSVFSCGTLPVLDSGLLGFAHALRLIISPCVVIRAPSHSYLITVSSPTHTKQCPHYFDLLLVDLASFIFVRLQTSLLLQVKR